MVGVVDAVAPAATITVPRPPDPPQAPGIPWIGIAAPLLVTAVLWIVTASPFVLVFALLSPVIAVAGWLDGRRHRRRDLVRAEQRYALECETARAELATALAADLEARLAAHPLPGSGLLCRWPPVVGRADAPGRVRVVGAPDAIGFDTTVHRAPVVAALPPGDVRILVTGPAVLAESAARALAVQAVEGIRDATVSTAASWAGGDGAGGEGPGRDGALTRITSAEGHVDIAVGKPADARGADAVLHVTGIARAQWNGEPVEPLLAGDEALPALGAAGATDPPRDVALSGLRSLGARTSVALGRSATGPLTVDLVADGPHAVLAGATGSGKSELLLGWLGTLLAQVPPERLSVLLVDFKGGTTFAGLASAPHCVGLVTDLDDAAAERAMLSLGAELRRREAVLREHGARDVAGTPLPRLMVVVDEVAAMFAALPQLEPLFADIAARGRALGVHLLLSTQRPVGERILSNCSIRIALHSPVDSDARTLLGPAPPVPAAARPGLARVRVGDRPPVAFQAARVDAFPAPLRGETGHRPWLEPLPVHLSPAETARSIRSADSVHPVGAEDPPAIVFGLVDDPSAQRRLPLMWRPARGALLVVGAPASGRSTTLDAIAADTGATVVGDAESLWDALEPVARPVARPAAAPLLVDDLDRLLSRVGHEYAGALADRLAHAMRQHPVVLTAQRPADLGRLAALCGDTLVLRTASAGDHIAAGAPATSWSASLPPGGGWWHGRRAQVHVPAARAERATVDPDTVLADGRGLLIVADRPAAVAARVAPRSEVLIPADTDRPLDAIRADRPVIAGTPEDWQQRWNAFRTLAQQVPVLLSGVGASELRMLLPRAGTPPLIDGTDRCWYLPVDGALERRLLPPQPPRT